MRDPFLRSPYYSGFFYPKEKSDLKKLLDFCFIESPFGPRQYTKVSSKNNKEKPKIFGLIVPHGSYIFSGPISANAFYEISSQYIDTFILIGPDHKGIGKPISIMSEGYWETPFGNVLINKEVTSELKTHNNIIKEDRLVHQIEHSLEIQIPFLQYSRVDSFTIVPILLKDQDIQTSIKLGNMLANTVTRKNALIIASSDFTHYELNLNAQEKDFRLFKSIQSLDIKLFYQTIFDLNISICGYGAIASLMRAAWLLGSNTGIVLRYATSGDVIFDNQSAVVSYAAIAFI
ncbi:MAG TPA: AmmeMemoRadiSam system protein B [Nitrososphaeraceae archaeon]|nr:AmmeMemoRadiSam system protein B [Nitrososphaeraceae archaeon]